MLAIWTEKYRPKTFEHVIGQKEIVSRVKALVETHNLPHLLFAGPPGVGKTTLSLVIARAMFGDNWKSNFLELNASDERGIDVIRVKVKDFARTRALGNVPFKIIYLDECDALTKEAQQALRRTMENYTQTTRFILSCNYSSKIIEPIQSRCAIFRFKPLVQEDIFALIDQIAKTEDLSVSPGAKQALFLVSEGDVRRLENTLQSCSALDKNISEEMIFSIAGHAKPQQIGKILEFALQNNFIQARSDLLKLMLDYGLSGLDVIKQIQKEIIQLKQPNGEPIDGRKRMAMMVACGETEFRMTEGSDEFIQLEALLANICLLGS